MNQEIKKKWIEALRSGKYKQTTGHLHDDIGYCCLGVLCELHQQAVAGPDNVWKAQEHQHDETKCPYPYIYLGRDDLLPLEVVGWAGLQCDAQCDIPVDDGSGIETLSSLNDDKHDFNEIADIIDANL